MKNLMVYVNPKRQFLEEPEKLVKIQIDNSLELGWELKDIILMTNFPFEYSGIRADYVNDDNFCDFRPLSTKTITVSNQIFLDDDIYWVHDLDCFQLEKFNINLDGYDLGCTDYGWSRKWNLGSYFYTTRAKDILNKIRETIYKIRNEDERAFMHITPSVENRIKRLNITYNLGYQRIDENYQRADKPLKVVHFHPGRHLKRFKNILSDRVTKIFNKYGYK